MVATQSASGGTFYSIIKGSFRRKVNQDTPNAVKRTNKVGEEVFELCFDRLDGNITSIEVGKTDFGQMIRISLSDGEILSIPFDSNEGRAFIKMLPNIDSSKPVSLNCWIAKDGKPAFTIKQGDTPVKWAFTKDNPNGMPPAIKKTVAGVDTWDFSEQKEFLYNTLLKESERFAGTKASISDFDDMKPKTSEPEIDDLPF